VVVLVLLVRDNAHTPWGGTGYCRVTGSSTYRLVLIDVLCQKLKAQVALLQYMRERWPSRSSMCCRL
jgi:hypothetical protein